MKRKLQIEQLGVESFETTSVRALSGTVYAAQETPVVMCDPTYGCVYTDGDCVRPTPSCGPTQTRIGPNYTCQVGCFVPHTDPIACCTNGACTNICGSV
jgi:hypothetical protein